MEETPYSRAGAVPPAATATMNYQLSTSGDNSDYKCSNWWQQKRQQPTGGDKTATVTGLDKRGNNGPTVTKATAAAAAATSADRSSEGDHVGNSN